MFSSPNSGDVIFYIHETMGIKITESSIVDRVEGNKVYVQDEYRNKHIFNLDTGYCYTDHHDFQSKKYLK